MSKVAMENGFLTYTMDRDKQFSCDSHMDISELTTDKLLNLIKEKFGRVIIPSVIWIAFDCTTFSIAAISHHRHVDPKTKIVYPKSDYAKFCDMCDQNVLKILEELRQINPDLIFYIENPRGMLQKMEWMKPYEKYKYLISYCKYQTDLQPWQRCMKPTNIWTNHPNPNFKPPCNNGNPDHARAPRGSKTGTQGKKDARERSMYPKQLCEHIVKISKEYIDKGE